MAKAKKKNKTRLHFKGTDWFTEVDKYNFILQETVTSKDGKNIVGFEKDELDKMIEEWRHANTTN